MRKILNLFIALLAFLFFSIDEISAMKSAFKSSDEKRKKN